MVNNPTKTELYSRIHNWPTGFDLTFYVYGGKVITCTVYNNAEKTNMSKLFQEAKKPRINPHHTVESMWILEVLDFSTG